MRSKIALIVVSVAVLFTFTQAEDLPWCEQYFFPIGTWNFCEMPLIPKENDWTDWDNRMDNVINWGSAGGAGLDAVKFKCYYEPENTAEVKNPGLTCYNNRYRDEDTDGVRDLIQCNREVIGRFSEENCRVFFWAGDLYYITGTDIGKHYDPYPYYKYYCWPGECGDQGGQRPPTDPYDFVYYCSSKPNIRDDIMDFFEQEGADYDIDGTILEQYDDEKNVVWYDCYDEPHMYELTPNSVFIEFMDEYSPTRTGLQNMVDRTGHENEQVYDDIDNFLEYVACRISNKILMARDYPFRPCCLPNSAAVYYGCESDGEYDQGFYGLSNHLINGRNASLHYDIPFWHVAELANEARPDYPNDIFRFVTPREHRAEANAALTYGASGMFYFVPYDIRLFYEENGDIARKDVFYSVMDIDGNVKTGNYTTGSFSIPYQTLYNEFVDLNTKLHSVRDTLQTTVSLDAFRYEDIPRSLVCDYVGNRDRGEDDDYPPDYEDCVDFLDFGTFVCPYTGVRYFAVSDRFCNWPPATYGDPFEDDEITVRHPGRIIFDVYDDDPNPNYFSYFKIDDLDHGNGVSTFGVHLHNADGRIFKLDPCMNYNPGFEDEEHPSTPPKDWTVTGQGAMIFTTDEEACKGDWSCKFYGLSEHSQAWLDNDATLDIGDDVFAGMTYRVSGYIKCSTVSTIDAHIQVIMEATPHAISGTVPVAASTDWASPGGWVYTQGVFTMPEIQQNPYGDTVWTRLSVHGGNEYSVVWFDDIRLEPLSRVFNGHFEHGKGDYWIGPIHGWGYNGPAPPGGWGYERSTPGRYGDYCLKMSPKVGEDNVVRNDEKLYLSKGTNYAVTGWAKREGGCPEPKVIVEFYTTKGVKFNGESYVVPAGGEWHSFTIAIAPNEWTEYDVPVSPEDGKPAYVKIACKVAQGSSGNAYFDNIELIETNPVPNGGFELAEEGPHWPDRWGYAGMVPQPDPGDPAWSALYDADAKYDRRCWRVRGPDTGNIKYGSETFPLNAGTSYRLSGWMRNFDVDARIDEGCYLKINLFDVEGNNLGSHETGVVASEEEWTYKYVDFTPPDGSIIECFGRVTVVEESGAYSSAVDGIRVLPTAIF